MPTYEYQCQTCLKRYEAVRRVADRKNGPICDCGDKTEQRIFTGRAFVAPDWNFEGYKCVATGKTITSARERTRVMKENDLVDAREYPAPDWDQMAEERDEFHEVAAKPVPVPEELKDAMVREGHGDLL